MATMNMNVNGLPVLLAKNKTFTFDRTETEDQTINIVFGDDLGFQPTNVSDMDSGHSGGSAEFSIVNNEDYTATLEWVDPGDITVGEYAFDYTIKDSFNRESTATITIEIE